MKRIVVIGGGESAEHAVSLAGADGLAAALEQAGFAVERLTISADGCWMHDGVPLAPTPALSLQLAVGVLAGADAVLPVVHGRGGEDGALAALCALAHVPVVGSGVAAGAIGMDKWATKLVAEAIGIRTAPAQLVDASDIGDIEFEQEVVVKPVSAGSSHGVTLVRQADQLQAALHEAAHHDRRILIEQVVRGREIDVAVLRDSGGVRWATPPLEIHANGLFDTASKYDGTARFEVPAELSRRDRTALTGAALRMFDALGCAGVARIDFFLTAEGPVLNEVNTTPGMTAQSQVPLMFAAAGVSYPELVRRMVASALEGVPR
ncbi:D-alanine--D-alanine ligase [Microbacterium sp. H1-D42]|uniref:D-alanine--D-alanine ligase family protein n=1 Tax=Microbacterium sp. H1-D42 TaxID=2925844 RepID=UPI001F530E26|nr:D-alanine--D-alanine ligase [Microbacterium sp. H1-D42]UNK70630.1 D-alanine--D-alanine ligase [Microbacterium sp. H1-D42]